MREDIISPEALAILQASIQKPNAVALPAVKMERALYEEVNEVLVRIGGKWKSKGKTGDGIPKGEHQFKYDPSPVFASVLESGLMPPKNPTAFFPTPKAIVDQMIEWAELGRMGTGEDYRVLEPSAGGGAIADAIKSTLPAVSLDLIEFLPLNALSLRKKGYEVQEMDFLEWRPEYQYHAILMNPPFSLAHDKKAYITHINHAFSMLKEGGNLVAITPLGFTFATDAASKDFLNQVIEFGEWAELPDQSFKESGTGVATCMLYMKKGDTEWKSEPYCGYPSYYSWEICLYVDNTSSLTKGYDKLLKKIAKGSYGVDIFGNPGAELKALIKGFYEKAAKQAQDERVRFKLDERTFTELFRLVMDDVTEGSQGIEQHAQAS